MSGWILWSAAAGVFIVMVIIHAIMGSGHPFRSAVISAVIGIAALIAVDLCSGFTNVFIPISRLSLGTAAVLGIPGVTMLLILQMIL